MYSLFKHILSINYYIFCIVSDCTDFNIKDHKLKEESTDVLSSCPPDISIHIQ